MRRLYPTLTTAFVVIALTASMIQAQQPAGPAAATSGKPTTPFNPMAAARSAKSLLRNGQDYLSYKKYDRALAFFREAQTRQNELDATDRKALGQAIIAAQRGLRESDDEADQVARRPARAGAPTTAVAKNGRAGGFTSASPFAGSDDQASPLSDEPVQRAGGVGDPVTAMTPRSAAPKPQKASSAVQPQPGASPNPQTRSSSMERPGELAPPVVGAAAQPIEIPEAEPVVVMPAETAAADLPPPSAKTARSTTTATPASDPSSIPPLPPPTLPPLPAAVSNPPAQSADLPETVDDADLPPLIIEERKEPKQAGPGPAIDSTIRPSTPPARTNPATIPSLPEPEDVIPPSIKNSTPPTLNTLDDMNSPSSKPTPIESQPIAPRVAAAGADQPRKPAGDELQQDLPPLPDSAPPPQTMPQPRSRVGDLPAPGGEIPTISPTIDELPPLPVPPSVPGPTIDSSPTPANPALETTRRPSPATDLPPLPDEMPAPIPSFSPDSKPVPVPARVDPRRLSTPDPGPDAGAGRVFPPTFDRQGEEPRRGASRPPVDANSFDRTDPTLGQAVPLGPELEREVEEIARRQVEESRQQRRNDSMQDLSASTSETATSGIVLPRAPSPTEARAIRPIPMPEEFVPLGPRNWSPTRKAWAAAATCHLPLYFQDASLERYGHSAEQFFGPAGRYMTYRLDDPTQSNQRNQVLQPFMSFGLFVTQIAVWPYNLIVDPPWEAEYDLGYYRPGDRVPTDVYYLPLHGVGPPLHGKNY